MSVKVPALSTTELKVISLKADRLKIGLALFMLYTIWGSTYFALLHAVESIPPFMMTSIRLLLAGAGMLIIAKARGAKNPTRVEWRNGLLTGAVMLGSGTGGIAFAEQQGVASGLAAVAVAAMPLWAALFYGLWGHWPSKREWLGLAVGMSGVFLLNLEHSMQSTPVGAIAAIIAPMGWAFASIWGKHLKLAGGLMTTATQMFGGCLSMAVVSLLFGERLTQVPTTSSILAVLYLVTFGAMIAFTAYTYLLEKVRPTLATSYAYVNPVVAVLLGTVLANEAITPLVIVAMIIILSGVALVAIGKTNKA